MDARLSPCLLPVRANCGHQSHLSSCQPYQDRQTSVHHKMPPRYYRANTAPCRCEDVCLSLEIGQGRAMDTMVTLCGGRMSVGLGTVAQGTQCARAASKIGCTGTACTKTDRHPPTTKCYQPPYHAPGGNRRDRQAPSARCARPCLRVRSQNTVGTHPTICEMWSTWAKSILHQNVYTYE